MQQTEGNKWSGPVMALALTLGAVLAALTGAPAPLRAFAVSGLARQATARVGRNSYRISGPYSYRNLSIFLLHSNAQDNRNFMTLPEGLKAGLVKVTERQQASVGELQISNLSDRPLFLQEGDRLQGGKQDRTTYASLVIPPRTRNVPLPAFCIEPGRWQENGLVDGFAATPSSSLAPLAVRRAARVEKDQGIVWDRVRETRIAASRVAVSGRIAGYAGPAGLQRVRVAGHLASRSAADMPRWSSYEGGSLNEVLDSPEIRRLADGCLHALGGVVDRQPAAVGVAIVLNGQIEEVNLYPGHALLRKLYPRLLQSYAVEMNVPSPTEKRPGRVSPTEIATFTRTGRAHSQSDEQIGSRNRLTIQHLDRSDLMISVYDGLPVHRQFLVRDKAHRPAPQGRSPVELLPEQEAGAHPATAGSSE